MKSIAGLFLLFLWCPGVLLAQPAVRVMTEELPPFNFEQNGVVVGTSAQVIRSLFQRVNCTMERGDIQMYPWARAYHELQHQPHTALFSMARTRKREELFQWVGPIGLVTIGVIAKKERNIEITTVADFNRYRIGTLRDSAPEQLLIKAGVAVETLFRLTFPELNIKKLQADRIDLFSFNVDTAKYMMLNLGLDPEAYETVYALKQADLYLALHKDTDPMLVTALQTALEQMKQPGNNGVSEFERITGTFQSLQSFPAK